jgi:hypothetical protein
MILESNAELVNTRGKLREVIDWRDQLMADDDKDQYVKALTLRSYERVIAQLQDQISDYEARRSIAAHKSGH